jgi:hypothetical protein
MARLQLRSRAKRRRSVRERFVKAKNGASRTAGSGDVDRLIWSAAAIGRPSNGCPRLSECEA